MIVIVDLSKIIAFQSAYNITTWILSIKIIFIASFKVHQVLKLDLNLRMINDLNSFDAHF
jgi:hypothetical protein